MVKSLICIAVATAALINVGAASAASIRMVRRSLHGVARTRDPLAGRLVTRLAVALAAALMLAHSSTAHAQEPVGTSPCAGDAPSALRFSGLPSRVPFGATTVFSLTYDSYDWDVAGPVAIRMESGGHTFYDDDVDDELAELYLELDLGDAPATVTATFVQTSATDEEAAPCTRTISARVRGFRHFGAIDRCDAPSYRPRSIVIACGDGNFGLESLRWRRWNRAVATASGKAYANDCVPYCAAGHFRRYSVKVRAFRVRRIADGYAYTRLRIRYTGARPPGARRVEILRAVTDAGFGWR